MIYFSQIEEMVVNVVCRGALGPAFTISPIILSCIWVIFYGVSSYRKICCIMMSKGRNF